MTSRSFATAGLRLMGVWLIVHGFLTVPGVLFGSRPFYDGSASANLYLHDTYYVIASFHLAILAALSYFGFGVILILASKLLAQLLCRGVDTESR